MSNSSKSSQPFDTNSINILKIQQQKLVKIYDKISNYLLALRQKQIDLLESIDQSYSQRMKLKTQLQIISKLEAQRLFAFKQQRQRQIFQELKKRTLAQQRLQQLQINFHKKHNGKDMQRQYKRGEKLLNISNANIYLQEQLNLIKHKLQLDKSRNVQIANQTNTLKLKRDQLKKQYTYLFGQNNDKDRFYNLNISQLLQQCQKLGYANRQLLPTQSDYDQMSTIQMIDKKDSEQYERQLLYDSIKQLKKELSQMQSENTKMQQILKNQR